MDAMASVASRGPMHKPRAVPSGTKPFTCKQHTGRLDHVPCDDEGVDVLASFALAPLLPDAFTSFRSMGNFLPGSPFLCHVPVTTDDVFFVRLTVTTSPSSVVSNRDKPVRMFCSNLAVSELVASIQYREEADLKRHLASPPPDDPRLLAPLAPLPLT